MYLDLVSRDALEDKVGACRLRSAASCTSIYWEASLGCALFQDLEDSTNQVR